MRCSCRVCGTYMVQEEYGLQSGCKCPDCGAMCHDCMGSAQTPLQPGQLADYFMYSAIGTGAEKPEDEPPEAENENNGGDWRKYL